MSDALDPQVQAAIVNGGFTFLGGGGVGLWGWLRGRRKSAQDQRCERICGSMVAAMKAMLAAMEALGPAKPGLANAIIEVRLEIEKAQRYLNGEPA